VSPHYREPSLITRLFNSIPLVLARMGISVYGSRELAVRGRKSGEWRTVPVNLLEIGGVQYLVAPRGETQWVRNLRHAGVGELRLGRQRDAFRATELPDGAKPRILRAYLEKWRFEVAVFFEGVGPEASDDDLLRIAPRHPIFRIEPA
jgi:deazaflavin-dependent oxidoreductase (nitroreductase family)